MKKAEIEAEPAMTELSCITQL